MSAFSENLRRMRFERHMTQEEFADLLGTTKQNISRYESGAVSPKISTAAMIASKLGVSLSELNGTPDSNDVNVHSDKPQTLEARIISGKVDSYPEETRKRILAMFDLLFEQIDRKD